MKTKALAAVDKKADKKEELDAQTPASLNILKILHADHQKVRDLFFEFSQAEEDDEKDKLVKTIIKELYVHASVEDEVVYPAVRAEAEDAEDIMDEADIEHHMVKLLMAELSTMKPGDDHYDAKVTVLCELVEHHVKEEEKEMFEKINDAEMDLDELAEEFLERKAELMGEGQPKFEKPLKTSSRGRARKTTRTAPKKKSA